MKNLNQALVSCGESTEKCLLETNFEAVSLNNNTNRCVAQEKYTWHVLLWKTEHFAAYSPVPGLKFWAAKTFSSPLVSFRPPLRGRKKKTGIRVSHNQASEIGLVPLNWILITVIIWPVNTILATPLSSPYLIWPGTELTRLKSGSQHHGWISRNTDRTDYNHTKIQATWLKWSLRVEAKMSSMTLNV